MQPDPALVRAFLEVARHVYAECDRAGVIYDDLPEMVLAAATRWCADDAETMQDLRALLGEMLGSRADLAKSGGPARSRATKGAMRCMRGVANILARYLLNQREGSSAASSLMERASTCLCYLGEPKGAAKTRVAEIFTAAGGLIPEDPRAEWGRRADDEVEDA